MDGKQLTNEHIKAVAEATSRVLPIVHVSHGATTKEEAMRNLGIEIKPDGSTNALDILKKAGVM